MAVNHITPINILSLNNFPFIENDYDAVTYYQLLCKVVEEVNEMVEIVNDLSDEVESLASQFANLRTLVIELQNQLNGIRDELEAYINARFQEIEEALEDFKDEIDSDILAFKADVNSDLTEFRDDLNTFLSTLNQAMIDIRNYVDDQDDANYNILIGRINDLQNQIDNIYIDQPQVYNPATGNTSGLQTALNDLWFYLRYDGMLTASEYDVIGITASEYDSLQISARDFDLYAKNVVNVPV